MQLVRNSVVSHPQLLCNKSITKPYRRQEVQRLIRRKNTDFFKKSSPFYRNSSVTKRPKMLQLCCVSRQSKPSATVPAHFSGHSGAFRFAYYCIYMQHFAYRGFCVRFCSASLCPLLRSFPIESKSELLCSGRHNSSFIKNTKKKPLHKKCAAASHNSGYAIELCSGQMITEQPLLPRSA